MTESVSVTVGGVAGAERGVNKERVNSRKRRVEMCVCVSMMKFHLQCIS